MKNKELTKTKEMNKKVNSHTARTCKNYILKGGGGGLLELTKRNGPIHKGQKKHARELNVIKIRKRRKKTIRGSEEKTYRECATHCGGSHLCQKKI